MKQFKNLPLNYKKLYIKGEPYRFSAQREPSLQTKKLTTLYNSIFFLIYLSMYLSIYLSHKLFRRRPKQELLYLWEQLLHLFFTVGIILSYMILNHIFASCCRPSIKRSYFGQTAEIPWTMDIGHLLNHKLFGLSGCQ